MTNCTGLKPCPFCGGEAEEYEYYFGDSRTPSYTVNCKNEVCGAEIGWHEKQKEANQAWNTRHKLERE